jgi:hypothetical protein
VQVTESVQRGLNEAPGTVPLGDVVSVGDGLPAGGLDLIDYVTGGSEVVDHDFGTLSRELQRMLTADASGRAGDDDDSSVV